MDTNKARKILNVDANTSDDDIKKSYKKLAAKYHPDRNKETDAEIKFKEVNEAYQFLTTGQSFGPTEPPHSYGSGFNINIEDLIRQQAGFGNFNRQKVFYAQDKVINTSISFKESVLGCQKSFSYERKIKCDDCDGRGQAQVSNGCTACQGTGFTTIHHGNIVMRSSCGVCHGNTKFETCKKCNSNGFAETNVTIQANIPPGVHPGRNILTLRGIGDYAGPNLIGDSYTNVILNVSVEKSSLSIEGNDVVSETAISLVEALEGGQIAVETIDGAQFATVPPLTKNKDEITIPKLGVGRLGNQRVKVNIIYPTRVDNLISFLKAEEN